MPLRQGDQVGQIRVDELLGKGGMSEVYRGYHLLLARPVALKVISEKRRLNRLARVRFMREARILSQLDHPGICRVHDLIQHGDQDVLVLEYIAGRTLRRAMNRGLEFEEALRIAAGVAEILAVAHEHEIVHRDLKPENIMITGEGVIKLLDFDLARPASSRDERITRPSDCESLAEKELVPGDGDGSHTSLGAVVGTVSYMSPEQARGEPLTVASDMYSLGIVMHEMISGTLPYPGGIGTKARLMLVGTGETQPLSGCDPRLIRLVEALKNVDPERRPSARQLAAALRTVLSENDGARAGWLRRWLAPWFGGGSSSDAG